MQLIFGLILAALAAWLVIGFLIAYHHTTGSTWERLLATAENSATMLWQKFVVAVSAVAAALGEFATYFDEPELASKVQALLNPKYVPFYMIAIAVVTIWARKRTLKT